MQQLTPAGFPRRRPIIGSKHSGLISFNVTAAAKRAPILQCDTDMID
jgi:hypothetical protein